VKFFSRDDPHHSVQWTASVETKQPAAVGWDIAQSFFFGLIAASAWNTSWTIEFDRAGDSATISEAAAIKIQKAGWFKKSIEVRVEKSMGCVLFKD
jgi:hypothetical protein